MERRPDARSAGRLHRRLTREAPVLGVRLPALVVLALMLAGAIIGQMALLGHVIARAVGGADLQSLLVPLLALFAALTVRAVVEGASSFVARTGAAEAMRRIRLRLLDKIAALGPAFLARERTGELVNTATSGVGRFDAYYGDFLPQGVRTLVLPTCIALFVLWLDVLSGVVLLITGPLVPLFMWLIGTWAERKTQRQWSAMSTLSAHFLDVLQGLPTLKLFGREHVQEERIRSVSDRFRRSTMDVLRVAFLSGLALELLASLSIAIVAVQAGVRLIEGLVDFESALIVLLLAPEFYLPFRRLGTAHHAGMEGVASAERIFSVLDEPEAAGVGGWRSGAGAGGRGPGVGGRVGAFVQRRAASPSQPGEPPHVAFVDVDYTYPGRGERALAGVSFEIAPRQTVGLVGPSGSGKSTVAAMLLGFVRPDSGVVMVDGRPLSEFDAGSWWRRVAFVPQHPHLFHGTLRSNLRAARPDAADRDILDALELGGLGTLVGEVAGGLDAVVGERGLTLSGGQRQRIALARAFLKNPSLLILDEPTAHLDPELESTLRESLFLLLQGRSALVITHRLSTAARADEILTLESGRIVERGAHRALLRTGGSYARLHQTAPIP